MGAVLKDSGSDVVDVANLTLEHDLLKHLTGLRRSYAAVLTADKKMDLCHPRWGKKPVVEGQPHSLRQESNHADCEFDNKDLEDPGSLKVQGMINFHPENAGEVLGKLKGLGQWDVGTTSPLNEIKRFCVNVHVANKLYIKYELCVYVCLLLYVRSVLLKSIV